MAKDLRSLPIGKLLSDYRIERVLGQGGFGITYLATDVKLMRQVALKEYYPREYAVRDGTLNIRATGDQEDRETFEWGLTRFLEEAQLLARFEHPNIIAVRRFFEANGTAYLVMDYSDGKPLHEIIKTGGPISEKQLERILYPLLAGLEQVHRTGFLHRDIKPANLYIRDDGSPVLLDFGAARRATPEHNQGVTTLVADGYSPVEQYDANGTQGPYTDIYGLGATLYRAVTGDKPQAASGRILNDTLVPAAKKAQGRYAENLLLAIDAAIAVRPENRPQTIAQWREILARPVIANAKISPSRDKADSPRIEPRQRTTAKQDPLVTKLPNINPRPKGRGIGTPGAEGGPPQTAGNLPTLTQRVDPKFETEEIDTPLDKPMPVPVPVPKASAMTRQRFIKIAAAIGVTIALLSGLRDWGNQAATDNAKEPAPPPVANNGQAATDRSQSNLTGVDLKDCDDCPVVRLAPAGVFSMGSPPGDVGRTPFEEPRRTVALDAFYVTKYEITLKEWASCAASGACQSRPNGVNATQDLPIDDVNWYDAQAYATWLSKKTGKAYQLLSEAQWEYAARAGSKSPYFFGDEADKLDAFAWFKGNAGAQTHAAGGKTANAFGLHDMAGNVAEWTADCWNESYAGAPIDGAAWKDGNCNVRVVRGGGWEDEGAVLRSAARSFGILNFRSKNIGFRLARKAD
jgi:formylglycine-generating enzyme required for sulfatase activity/serine/threonine protein kinase